jgi:hypothetical protein
MVGGKPTYRTLIRALGKDTSRTENTYIGIFFCDCIDGFDVAQH